MKVALVAVRSSTPLACTQKSPVERIAVVVLDDAGTIGATPMPVNVEFAMVQVVFGQPTLCELVLFTYV